MPIQIVTEDDASARLGTTAEKRPLVATRVSTVTVAKSQWTVVLAATRVHPENSLPLARNVLFVRLETSRTCSSAPIVAHRAAATPSRKMAGSAPSARQTRLQTHREPHACAQPGCTTLRGSAAMWCSACRRTCGRVAAKAFPAAHRVTNWRASSAAQDFRCYQAGVQLSLIHI